MKKFDVAKYISSIGKELLIQFERSSLGTHTHAIGESKEIGVLKKMEMLLPTGVGVGRGFVFDIDGNVSNQCDIVIYEKDYAIKLMINDDEKNTYFNCESVIAVGEIKTQATLHEIKNSIEKIQNLRSLKRENKLSSGAYRTYLNNFVTQGIEENTFSPETKSLDQIYAFILAENIATPIESVKKVFDEMGVAKNNRPNLILDISGKAIINSVINDDKVSISIGAIEANSLTQLDLGNDYFIYLINQLTYMINNGRSVRINTISYLSSENGYKISKCIPD